MLTRKAVLGLGVVLLLALSSPAFAANSSKSSSMTLSMNLAGGVISAGDQSYSIRGGQLVTAAAPGFAMSNGAKITYSVSAVVSGLSTSGSATFDYSSSSSGGAHTYVHGSAVIVDALPGGYFPLGCTPGANCTTQIPSGFVAVADITVSVCQGSNSAGKCTPTTYSAVPMVFESSYLNPFGGPIFFGSTDGSFSVVATYTLSTISWDGVQLGGAFTGTLGGASVSGTFLQTVSSTEDLRGGFEVDHGSIVFASDNAAVQAQGSFLGLSRIPHGTACPSDLPFPPGTCQITGFTSTGAFYQTNSAGGSIIGAYSIQWTAPAFAFAGTVTALVR